jgi:gliding motility-associated-like protein
MKSVLRIILFLFISFSAFSQGICDMTAADGIELGDFDMPAAVCIGENFDAVDRSGGTGIKYIFGYSGQPISALPTVSSLPGPNASWAFAASGQFVVLQYGRKNNKDMYRCKVITVRTVAEPIFTTSACNSFLSISIADTAANNFSSYVIDWGEGPVETVTGSLPIQKNKNYLTTYQATRTIRVEGKIGTSNCPTPPARVVDMNGGADYPNIKTLELSEDNKSATITFTGAADKYDVYQRSATGFYQEGQPIAQVKPGTYKFNLVDANQSCFKLFRNFGCKEGSGEVCTTKWLDVKAVDKTNVLTWQTHPSGHQSTTYDVLVKVKSVNVSIKKEEVGGSNTPIPSPGNPLTDLIDCSKKYCYQLETKVTGTIDNDRLPYSSTSLSPKACVDRAVVKPDPITESIVSVKEDNSVAITIEDNSLWALQRKAYLIYRIEPDASLKEINNSPTATPPFTDNAIDASTKSFCYKIAFKDECGSTSELSPALCTINLAEGAGNTLQWTNDSPFGAGIIDNFEILSYNEFTNIPTSEAIKNGSETTYTPQLQNFQDEAKYRIRAVTASGKESFSNIYIIPLAVKLFLPDAFSPNDDTVNDNLEIKGSFKRIKDFEFQIFNRWGNPVFTSTDPTQSWDGKFAATLAPVDTYSYRIYAKLKTGEEVTKSGNFLLIR